MAKSSDSALGCLIGLVVLAFIILSVASVLIPIVIVGLVIYWMRRWYLKRLAYYEGDFGDFFQAELKKRLVIGGTLFFVAVVFLAYLGNRHVEEQEIKQALVQEQEEEARIAREAAELALQLRIDSSNVYLSRAIKEYDRRWYKTCLVYVDSALLVLPSNEDALYRKGLALQKRKRYAESINIFEDLSLLSDNYTAEVHLEIGRCLLKKGDKKKAALELHHAKSFHSEEAETLYEKANPMIKEIVGYTTRCCDGTTSNARGRGACSHHGGVCNWNSPIYSSHRKYTIK